MTLVAHLAALGDGSVSGCAHRHCSLPFPAPAPITKASRLHETLRIPHILKHPWGHTHHLRDQGLLTNTLIVPSGTELGALKLSLKPVRRGRTQGASGAPERRPMPDGPLGYCSLMRFLRAEQASSPPSRSKHP